MKLVLDLPFSVGNWVRYQQRPGEEPPAVESEIYKGKVVEVAVSLLEGACHARYYVRWSADESPEIHSAHELELIEEVDSARPGAKR